MQPQVIASKLFLGHRRLNMSHVLQMGTLAMQISFFTEYFFTVQGLRSWKELRASTSLKKNLSQFLVCCCCPQKTFSALGHKMCLCYYNSIIQMHRGQCWPPPPTYKMSEERQFSGSEIENYRSFLCCCASFHQKAWYLFDERFDAIIEMRLIHVKKHYFCLRGQKF